MAAERRDDEGFGLVEVMVAMILLAVIMVSMLSVILSGLRATANAATYATASQLVQQRLEDARAVATSADETGLRVDNCADVIASVTATPAAINDGRGVPIVVAGSVTGDCATDNLVTVTMTASTTQAGFNNPMAETTTKIYVKGAP